MLINKAGSYNVTNIKVSTIKILRNKLFLVLLITMLIAFVVLLLFFLNNNSKSKSYSQQEKNINDLTEKLIPLSSDYQSAPKTSKPKILDEAVKVATKREQLLQELIKKDPSAVENVVISEKVRSLFPEKVKNLVEEEKTISGDFEAIYADDFKNKRGEIFFHVKTKSEKITLKNLKDQEAQLSKSGKKVSIHGIKLGQNLIAFSGSTVVVDDSETINSNTIQPGVRKTAVILINFRNNTQKNAQPYSTEEVRSEIFGNNNISVNDYYKKVSSGKTSLVGKNQPDGDIYGWYTIDYDNTVCDYIGWREAAKAKAQQSGADLSGYDNFMFVFPRTTSCSWSGSATVLGSDSWINGDLFAAITGHELGHNFGLHHASSRICKDSSGVAVFISQNCTDSEYGNWNDIMGSFGPIHFNTFNMSRINYLNLSNTTTVTQSGSYVISPLGKTQTGVQAIRIPRDSKNFLYLEFRPQDPQNGVFMTSGSSGLGVYAFIAPGYNTLSRSYLLDANKDSNLVTLPIGQSITDSDKGFSIKLTSQTADSAIVEVNFSGDPIQPDTTPPTTPINLQATVQSATSAKLSWSPSTDDISVAGYDIYRDGIKIANTTQSSYVDQTLKSGSKYLFSVKAVDTSSNQSPMSQSVSVTTTSADTQPPTVPTNLRTISVSTNQATISWQPSTDNVAVDGYNVYRNGIKLTSISSTSFGDATVTSGQSYTYSVAAYDSSGNTSSPSAGLKVAIPSQSSSNTGNITGTIRQSRSSAPVVGRNVSLYSVGSNSIKLTSATTGLVGDFQFTNIAPGSYQLGIISTGKNEKKYSVGVTSNNTTVILLEVHK